MTFSTALSGLQSTIQDLGIVGNNIANVNTTGFKQSRGQFADVYAASALGTSATAIGTGVRLSAVAQQFTQGTVETTNNNLDLAINGGGFFILNDNGSSVYSRAGQFGLNQNGDIVSSTGKALQGFQADVAGNITGNLGTLNISSANLAPSATATVASTVNLNSTSAVPSSTWLGTASFGGAAPSATSYNNATSTTIYDSLGNAHIITGYFVKNTTANLWDVRFQVDGVDVSTSAPKANSVTTSAGVLTTAGSLSALAAGALTINGTPIAASLADGVSTTDDTASARAIATTINLQTGTTGVTATANPATLNLGTLTAGVTAGAQFVINGTNIVSAAATQVSMLAAINGATGATGVSAATNASNEIVLTAADGRNIQVSSNGTAPIANFSSFLLSSVNNDVKRASVTLSSNAPIVVSGNAPSTIGVAAATYLAPWALDFNSTGTFNAAGSDTISLNWTPLDPSGNPNGATSPQTVTIDLSTATQFGSPFAVQAISQNGFTTGRLNQVQVDPSGIIFGRYSNGQSKALGQVVLSNFANVQGLQPLGNTNWGQTFSSGPAVVSPPGTASLGTVQSGALEASNSDLTQELVKLIVDQRNFQANAKTIQTLNTTTQTIIDLR